MTKKSISIPDLQGCSTIDDIRNAIDAIDEHIVEILGIRFQFVKEIVKFKENDPESIRAPQRYNEVLQRRRTMAEKNGLSPDVIENMYKNLIEYFIAEEMKEANMK